MGVANTMVYSLFFNLFIGNIKMQNILAKSVILFCFLCSIIPLAYGSKAITLVDDIGVTHTFSTPVKRIVSLTPHATELLFAVGAGAQIVGAVDYSDYPKAALKIPRVGGYSGINIEVLMMLKPDVIISWPGGNRRDDLAKIKKLNLPLFASNPKNFAGIASNLQRLGILTGHPQQGQRTAYTLLQKTQKLRQENQHKDKIRVFYQVWDKPLMTLNKQSFIAHAINLCGGVNVFADLPTISAQVSLESVIAAKPEVIITGGHTQQSQQWFKKWRNVKGIKAVTLNNLYQIAPDILSRPTPRLYEGTRQLCKALDSARKKRADTRF